MHVVSLIYFSWCLIHRRNLFPISIMLMILSAFSYSNSPSSTWVRNRLTIFLLLLQEEWLWATSHTTDLHNQLLRSFHLCNSIIPISRQLLLFLRDFFRGRLHGVDFGCISFLLHYLGKCFDWIFIKLCNSGFNSCEPHTQWVTLPEFEGIISWCRNRQDITISRALRAFLLWCHEWFI